MAQFDMVRRLGASCIQGYLFSKPLLSADLDLWFEAQQQRVLSTPEDMSYRQAS
jgi:EAL domain-containing protein (putative c-di-GMP-specific phosphodiesterase class I)